LFYLAAGLCRVLFGVRQIGVDFAPMMKVVVYNGIHVFDRQDIVVLGDLFGRRSGVRRPGAD